MNAGVPMANRGRKMAGWVAVLAALAPPLLDARLKYTTDECRQSYGEPVSAGVEGLLATEDYRTRHYNIRVYFYKQYAVVIAYRKTDPRARFASRELDALLEENSHGYAWDEKSFLDLAITATNEVERRELMLSSVERRAWRRADGMAEARYDKLNPLFVVGYHTFWKFVRTAYSNDFPRL